jgi:hypothetical protein
MDCFAKARRIERAIRTRNVWHLRELAVAEGGLLHGTLRTDGDRVL